MNVKKTLISVASYALVGALAIGGTVAYLSDRSTATNAFTVGDVEIQLNEDFVQGSELLPGNKVKKEVSIENTGDNDAWVWYTYATPVATSNMGGSASKNIVHINIPGAYWGNSDKDATKGQYYKEEKYWVDGQTEAVDWEDTWCVAPFDATRVQTINGVEYYIQPVLYNGTIEPGEVTNIGMNTVYLDTHIDYNKNDGKYYWVEKGEVTPINDADYDLANYKMYVAAYAVQDTDEIDNVQEAYDAFMKQWTADGNVNTLVPNYEEGAVSKVDSSAELSAALASAKSGDVVIITEDIEDAGALTIPDGVAITGNGSTIKAASIHVGDGVEITGLNFDAVPEDTHKTTQILASGSISLNDCTFTNTEYECLQLTPVADSKIEIVNCEFTAVAGNQRLVHIEVTDKAVSADPDNGIEVIMTGNTFTGMDLCVEDDDPITIAGVFAENITAADNTGIDSKYVWTGVRDDNGDGTYSWSTITVPGLNG